MKTTGSKIHSASSAGKSNAGSLPQVFNAKIGETQYTVTDFTVDSANIKVFVGGILQLKGIDYTVAGQVITFTVPMLGGEYITVFN